MKVSKLSDSISLKDFDQKDTHRFLNYRGTELYDKFITSSTPRDQKISDLKRGKYKPNELSSILKKGVTITFPANNREYSSKDFVFQGDITKGNYDKDFDIVIQVRNGIIEFPDVRLYRPMASILPKYHNSETSTWQYKFFNSSEDKSPYPVLSVPVNSKDWDEIIKACTEFAVFLKLFTGCYFKIYITVGKSESRYFKYYSSKETITSLAPTIFNAGYLFFAYPLIMGKLGEALAKTNRNDVSPGLSDRILKYCQGKYKDIYFVNLGTGSCFLNPKLIDDPRPLYEIADPKRLRTMWDWVLKAYEDGKYIIFYSDLDHGVALAHEVGHYLEDKDGTLGLIQRKNKSGLFSDNFISFFGLIAGIFSGAAGGFTSKLAGWTEAISTATGILLKSPLLFSEFMASYKGLQVMKDAGCSEEEIKKAKEFFRIAWNTYLAGSVARAGMSPALGRAIGGGLKEIEKYNHSLSAKTFSFSKETREKIKEKLKFGAKKVDSNVKDSLKTAISGLKGDNNYITYDY